MIVQRHARLCRRPTFFVADVVEDEAERPFHALRGARATRNHGVIPDAEPDGVLEAAKHCEPRRRSRRIPFRLRGPARTRKHDRLTVDITSPCLGSITKFEKRPRGATERVPGRHELAYAPKTCSNAFALVRFFLGNCWGCDLVSRTHDAPRTLHPALLASRSSVGIVVLLS